VRRRPVGHGDFRSPPLVPVGPAPAARRLILGSDRLIAFQHQLASQDQREDHTVAVDALAAKHAANGDGSKPVEQFAYALVIHRAIMSRSLRPVMAAGDRWRIERVCWLPPTSEEFPDMPILLKGSCHCGAVRFEVESHTPAPYQL